MPATSPYASRHHLCATVVQRLTTARPWRHAPRFFLSGAPVANRPTNRVSRFTYGTEGGNGSTLQQFNGAAVRRTPPDCR
ncbi:hypothetical protein DMA10_00025 [Streptomyces sp. WAC 01420]|nr:hypothetical protein DLM49_20870 [Streptomyces sp. WAC 01438]RSN02127.1 hypothetical protein DMA10_00025 [Streptomyces sp. WAC 01420]